MLPGTIMVASCWKVSLAIVAASAIARAETQPAEGDGTGISEGAGVLADPLAIARFETGSSPHAAGRRGRRTPEHGALAAAAALQPVRPMQVDTIMMMPAVSRYMTERPCTVERTATLSDAHQIMREHAIRHLPVLDGGTLCGIVSDRDLRLVEAVISADPDTTPVSDAMTESPFIVTSDTALDEVVEIMYEHKYGSVVVMGKTGVEGIFTAIDACRALVDILQQTEREALVE